MAEPGPTPTPPAASPAQKSGFGRMLTGTRPGLERLLLASVPALIAGSVGGFVVAPWAGVLGAAAAFASVWWLSRGLAE